MEGAIAGVPAFAISLDTRDPSADYQAAADFAAHLALRIAEQGLPERTLLNVNVPARPMEEIRGVRVTRMGLRIYHDELLRREDPAGRPYYWIGGAPPTGYPEPGTDIGALAEGYISITPIQLDFTAYVFMDRLAGWKLETWAEGRRA